MRKQREKVSIILPTYNGAKYLQLSIDSCLGQTYQDLELIVVDDGSTDDTPRIVESFSDDRILLVRHEDNRGLPASLNTGFSRCSGAYLSWTSDDNLFLPEAIQRMVDYLERNEKTALVYADCHRIDAEGDVKGLIKQAGPKELYCYNCVGTCFLYRREVYDALGNYREDLTLIEDHDYWLRASLKFKLGKLDEVLYLCRAHEGSLTSKYAHTPFMNDQVRKLRRKYLFPWLRHYVFFEGADEKRSFGRAAAHMVRSFFRHPALWKKVIYMISMSPYFFFKDRFSETGEKEG